MPIDVQAEVIANQTLSRDYNVVTRNAVNNPGGNAQYKLFIDGTQMATVPIPNTGGWQNFALNYTNSITISSGKHYGRWYADTAKQNLDYLETLGYHFGDFFSGVGAVGPGMVTLHPVGLPHGPKPRAIEKCREVLAIDPKNTGTRATLAASLARAGEAAAARSELSALEGPPAPAYAG